MELEKYYDEIIKSDDTPAFSDLSEEQISRMKNSWGFASFRVSIAAKDLRAAFMKIMYTKIK